MQLITGLLLQVLGRESFKPTYPWTQLVVSIANTLKALSRCKATRARQPQQYSRRDTGLSLAYSVIKVFVRITAVKTDSDQNRCDISLGSFGCTLTWPPTQASGVSHIQQRGLWCVELSSRTSVLNSASPSTAKIGPIINHISETVQARNLHTGFPVVPTLVTLNDFERRNGRYLALFYQIPNICGLITWLKLDPCWLRKNVGRRI